MAKQHYRPAVFQRCLAVLTRLSEGYTPGEIRLELGWDKSTYEGTMALIRNMSRFAEGYHRAPGRNAPISETEIARIRQMHESGRNAKAISRIVGRDHKRVLMVINQASAQVACT